VWIAALWAVVVSAGLAVGWPQSKGPDPAGSDPDLKAARAWALRYTQTLPDFVCTEFVRRYQNWTGTDFKVDTLTFRVSFNQQREAYELVARNQNPSHQSVESLNGSTTKGEFGSALRLIFDRESAAVFEPQKPERLQRRILAVYGYAVRQENSHYRLEYGYSRILTAYHGRVYIDPSTGRVLRLTTEVDPPRIFTSGRRAPRLITVSVQSAWRNTCCRSTPKCARSSCRAKKNSSISAGVTGT